MIVRVCVTAPLLPSLPNLNDSRQARVNYIFLSDGFKCCLAGPALLRQRLIGSTCGQPPCAEESVTGTSFFSLEKISEGRSGGTTQAESRIHNERLIVSLIRRNGQLAKTDLTRLT